MNDSDLISHLKALKKLVSILQKNLDAFLKFYKTRFILREICHLDMLPNNLRGQQGKKYQEK